MGQGVPERKNLLLTVLFLLHIHCNKTCYDAVIPAAYISAFFFVLTHFSRLITEMAIPLFR